MANRQTIGSDWSHMKVRPLPQVEAEMPPFSAERVGQSKPVYESILKGLEPLREATDHQRANQSTETFSS